MRNSGKGTASISLIGLYCSTSIAQVVTPSGEHEGFDLALHIQANAGSTSYWAMALTCFLAILCWHGAVVIWRRRGGKYSLAKQVAAMRSMLDEVDQPIFIRDCAGRLVYCNNRFLEIRSIDFSLIQGTKLTENKLLHPEMAKKYHLSYLKVMDERKPHIVGSSGLSRTHLATPNNFPDTSPPISYWVFPIFDHKGDVVGLIAGWIDISDRQQLLDQLKASQKEAEEANKAKTTFLATMSHEIRTPMNAVLGMLEMASKRAEQGIVDKVSLDVASSAANGLVDLIGDILDIVRIESGQLTLTPGQANLQSLCQSVARIFDGVAQQKLLDLKVELDPRADCDVWVDSLRLKQIISNLLSNAIKFTVKGEVRLSLYCVAVTGGKELDLIFNVKDTGIGISHEDQARLFSPFSQVGSPEDSMRKGSGLGLAITRTLCEMMNGQLSLTSAIGNGTDVSVTLRLPVLESTGPAAVECVEPVVHTKRLSVLVVDDYPANRILLSQQLTYLGHDVSDAEDGALALRAWRRGAFDVVISDCHMPVMNGCELARAIRAEESRLQTPRCLIIGLTANALPGEKERCVEAGMDDCLFKPISLQSLSARLAMSEPKALNDSRQEAVIGQGHNLDLTTLRQLARGDEQSINTLMRDLAGSLDEDLARLLDRHAAQDLGGLADLAHRVKGGARIVGGQNVIIQCNRLEAASTVENPINLKSAVDALAQAIVTLSAELKVLG